MKNITVFSFFNSSNIGDLLIAESAVEFFSGVPNCRFCNISGEPIDIVQWRKQILQKQFCCSDAESQGRIKKALLKNSAARSVISFCKSNQSVVPQTVLKNSEGSDTVIFFGGNLVMELYKLPTSILVLYRSIAALKNSGKKVFLCAVGVGPFENRMSRKLAGEILKLTDGISVRDDASYDLARQLAPQKKVSIIRDPVLTMDVPVGCETKNNAFGVNVYFGPYKKMHRKMEAAFVEAIRFLRNNYSHYTIYLFSSEKVDYDHVLAVKSYFQQDDRIVVRNIESPDELFKLHNQVDCVVGTRMHTIITAMISHKPVLSLSWQGKVTSLVEFFENKQWNIPIKQFVKNPNLFSKTFESLICSKEKIVQRNQNKIAVIKHTYREQIEKELEGA